MPVVTVIDLYLVVAEYEQLALPLLMVKVVAGTVETDTTEAMEEVIDTLPPLYMRHVLSET